MLKKFLFITAFIAVSLGFIFQKTLFQEGNPVPILSGIVQLNFTPANIVQLPNGDFEHITKYMTKNGEGRDFLLRIMKDREYELTDVLGSGYVFEKEDKTQMLITHRHYSRFYDIWYFPKT